MYPFLTFCLLISIYILRILVRSKVKYALDSDTYFHLELARHIKSNNYNFRKEHPQFLLPGKIDYPYLFHLIYSLIPRKFFNKGEIYISSSIDLIHSIILYGFLYIDPINLNLNEFNITIITLLHATSPNFLAKQAGPRAYQATPRVLSEFLYFIYFLGLILSAENYTSTSIIITSFFGCLLLLTSKFGAQVLFLFTPGIFLFEQNINSLLIPFGSFILAIILSKGYYWSVFTGQLSHLGIYKNHLVHVHPQFKVKNIESNNEDNISIKFFNYLRHIKHNSMIGKMIFNLPVMILGIFSFVRLQLEIANPILNGVFVSSILIGILTSTKKFKFLGEGARYLDYSLASSYILIVIFFDRSIIILLFLYQIIIATYSAKMFISTRRSSTKDYLQYFKPLKEELLKYPSTKKIFPIWPSAPWQLFYEFNNPITYTISINKKYWPGDSYKNTFPEYPHINPKCFSKFEEVYGIDLIIIHKPTFKRNERNLGEYPLENYTDLYENKYFLLKGLKNKENND